MENFDRQMEATEEAAARFAETAEMDRMGSAGTRRREAFEAVAEAAATAETWAEFFAATEQFEDEAAEAMEAAQ
jgi:hypothetical protein